MSELLFINKFGWGGVVLILVVVLLLFGGKKIPELMRGLGSGVREFKDASKGEDKKEDNTTDSKEKSSKDK